MEREALIKYLEALVKGGVSLESQEAKIRSYTGVERLDLVERIFTITRRVKCVKV